MIKLNNFKILKIAKKHFIYLYEGKKYKIDLIECNNNWNNYNKSENSNYIGQRNIDHDECYIEFFTKPFIRFEMKNEKEFLKLNKNIMKYGWKTIDLS